MKCRNYQEIKVQEQVQRLALGTIPRSMWVVIEMDLVDSCKAGDDVTIWYVHGIHKRIIVDYYGYRQEDR